MITIRSRPDPTRRQHPLPILLLQLRPTLIPLHLLLRLLFNWLGFLHLHLRLHLGLLLNLLLNIIRLGQLTLQRHQILRIEFNRLQQLRIMLLLAHRNLPLKVLLDDGVGEELLCCGAEGGVDF